MNSSIQENEETEEDAECTEITVLKYRQTLNKSFINVFSKHSDDCNIPDGSIPPNFSKFMQCFRYCLEVFPQMFLPLPSTTHVEPIASAFTEWLMMRLLKALSEPYSKEVHDGCEDLFVSLLQVVRTSDPMIFRKYVLALLTLMSDLISFQRTNGGDTLVIEKYFAIQKNDVIQAENLDLSDCPILISTSSKCDSLQEKIVHLVQKLRVDLFLFLPDQTNNLWKMLCLQIETSCFPVKEASLLAISDLVAINGLPKLGLQITYTLDCLQALIAYCLSSHVDNVNKSKSFETAVATCLESVVKYVHEDYDFGLISDFVLSRMMENIIQAIISSGLSQLSTNVLKKAIMQTIISFISCLKGSGIAFPQQTMFQFQKSLCSHFNEIDTHEFMSPLLVFLIMDEVGQNKQKLSPQHKSNSRFLSSMDFNSNEENVSVFLKMNRSSVTWSMVLEHLLSLIKDSSSLSDDATQSNMNAVSICLYVLLQTSLRFSLDTEIDQVIWNSDCSSTADSSSYLPADTLSLLLRYIRKHITTASFRNVSLLKEIYSICFNLVCFQDILFLSSVDYEFLSSTFSLPWQTEENTLKLQIPTSSSVSLGKLQNIPSELKIRCLKALSLLPSSVMKSGLLDILKFCTETDEVTLRIAAIKILPFILYQQAVQENDVQSILRVALLGSSTECFIVVSQVVGKLNCLLHSPCLAYRSKVLSSSLEDCFPIIKCKVCDLNSDCLKNNSLPKSWITKLLIELLSHNDAAVRKESVLSIKSFAVHENLDDSLFDQLLQMLTDSDCEVQKNFSKVAKYILQPLMNKSGSSNTDREEVLVKRLKSAFCAAKSSGNHELWENIILTITEFGKVADHRILLICIISLLECVLSFLPSVAATARHNMKELASYKQYKMQDLFKIYIEPICTFITDSMLSCDSEDTALNNLEKISLIFGYSDLKGFLHITQTNLLPYLIRRYNERTSSLIHLYSQLLKTNKRDLLLNNFPFIFSHLVCHCNKEELSKALVYVEKETELEFGSLLRCNYQLIHNQLLLHISTHYDKVFGGLETLALKSGSSIKKKAGSSSKEHMADYLQPKLLGFLVFFDSQLLKSSITLDDKKMALESLIIIMQLMGQRYITAVRFKLMATLRIALRFKDENFPKICCRAWKTFVHNLEVTALGPLLNQVIVALLPLLDVEFGDIAEIFSFLIIDNQDSLKEFFHELYFIPDVPQLKMIHTAIKTYSENPSSRSDFQAVLQHSLKGVSHENLEVRLHALANLRQILLSNQTPLYEHILERESVDHLLSYLLAVVIPGCRESDPRARVLLGECLGMLGAVDPGRLEMKNVSSKNGDSFLNSVEDENFAFVLIQELTRSFHAATDCRIQDCSSYAIQEVLHIYQCYDRNESSSSQSNSNLWRRFTPDVQEILQVLSNSQYKRLEKIRRSYPKPIYKSSVGSKFSDWVTNWFMHLLLKVQHANASKLFHSCSMIMKYDLNCALFLLPHIVVYAIMDADDVHRKDIVAEVLAVLSDSEELTTPSDLCQLSSQSIFSVFDHLMKWMCWKEKSIAESTRKQSGSKLITDTHFTSVKKFVDEIPKLLLAKSSFNCHAYTRSLMYLELHLKENASDLENNISFLQKIYAALDEPDGVSGVVAIRTKEPSLKDSILEHEATGDMQAAFACYEKAISIYPEEVNYYGGLLKCFIRMDQPSTALTYANGILNNRPEWENELNSYRVEAAWKLANWDSVDMFLTNEKSSDKWNVGVGKLLLCMNNKNLESFQDQIKHVRCNQMAPLSAASMEKGAYLRGYEHLTRLHMLTDLERSVKLLDLDNQNLNASSLGDILSEWKLRQQLVQSSLRYQEPILDMHRVLLNMFKVKHSKFSEKFDAEISSCWLESAKLARKNGHHQRAYSCLLESAADALPALFMEKSKWHWSKGEKEQAINCLEKNIKEHFTANSNFDTKALLAKARLLLATYSEESSITDSKRLLNMYKEIVTMQPKWEEGHYYLAKYYDKVVCAMSRPEDHMEKLVHVAKSFGMSLHYGCKHVYHSLPRLLDIWFDMGTQVAEIATSTRKPTSSENIKAALSQLTSIVIPELWEKLPLYLLMTAFPQLISRICHSDIGIFFQLQTIIVKLLATYSQQCIWMMLAVSKSSYAMRVQRCKKIFQAALSQKSDLGKFIQDATRLADELIELCNKNVPDTNTFDISRYFPSLLKLVKDRHFSPIMLPLQSQMIVTLPSKHVSSVNHNPFPFKPIYIQGFHSTVDVFTSLQKPKKIKIKGSDGQMYGIICKPKDDLRKDCRFMEFNNLVNRYLMRDPEARKRQLYIRTYAVIPLNEECGLIEYIPNLSGMRPIIMNISRNKGIFVSVRDLKALMPPQDASSEQKLTIFKSKVMPRFPPVFKEWFYSTFPDPTSWYHARLSYARTTSVMSMVGYIVGLGDRHGENVLIDSSCGDIVHVDLNCLFNKGEIMECPERVPFRLTHNMVDAMGPTGYEGIFRKACEVTIRVMRSQTDALMSVLRPFVHDPLVEWSKRSSRLQPTHCGEIRNEMGLTHVKDIELRLNGIIRSKNKAEGLPLSIEGQVNYLIQEATDERNLSQMYIGWAAYY